MLFVSPTLAEQRSKLLRQIERGALTPSQAFRRVLEFDPFDALALVLLGTECQKQDDSESARRYFWRAAESAPANFEPYLCLMRSFESSGELEVAEAFAMLAVRKAVASPEGSAESITRGLIEKLRRQASKKLKGVDDKTLIEAYSSLAFEPAPDEPEQVSNLLFPHRLIQRVIERGVEGMTADAVDRIVENGDGCVPLLIGVVRGWARGDDLEDSALAATAALALLGEIGAKAALPAIRECLDIADPLVAHAAKWAVERITGPADPRLGVYRFCCDSLETEAEVYQQGSQEPMRKAQRPERNDPCWCGSGKKYKKCHLDSDERGGAEDSRPQDRRISDMLMQFVKDNVKHDEMQQAITLFFGASQTAEAPKTDSIAFFDWLLNDYKLRRFGRTVAQAFLARNSERLAPADRRYLEEWTNSYYSLFEAQRVEKGIGVQLKDLLQGDEMFVHDVSASGSLTRWDCILARVRLEGDRTIFTGVAEGLNQMDSQKLREWILSDKEGSGLDWIPYLRANSHRVRQEWAAIGEEKRNNMRFVTAEGDELVFSKTSCRVRDRQRLLAALEGEKLIGDRTEEDGGIRFTWFETPEVTDQGRRVLGSLRLEGDKLTLECSSRERLRKGAALIRKLAGDAVDRGRNEFLSAQDAMREMPKSAAPEPAIPPEVEKQIVTEWKEKHFRAWLDMKLPALGGRTPREAASHPDSRVPLISLLKDVENAEDRERIKGRAWYDVSRLKAELGVDF